MLVQLKQTLLNTKQEDIATELAPCHLDQDMLQLFLDSMNEIVHSEDFPENALIYQTWCKCLLANMDANNMLMEHVLFLLFKCFHLASWSPSAMSRSSSKIELFKPSQKQPQRQVAATASGALKPKPKKTRTQRGQHAVPTVIDEKKSKDTQPMFKKRRLLPPQPNIPHLSPLSSPGAGTDMMDAIILPAEPATPAFLPSESTTLIHNAVPAKVLNNPSSRNKRRRKVKTEGVPPITAAVVQQQPNKEGEERKPITDEQYASLPLTMLSLTSQQSGDLKVPDLPNQRNNVQSWFTNELTYSQSSASSDRSSSLASIGDSCQLMSDWYFPFLHTPITASDLLHMET